MAHHKHEKKHEKSHGKHRGEDKRVPPSVGGFDPQSRKEAEISYLKKHGKKLTHKQKKYQKKEKRAERKERESDTSSRKIEGGKKYPRIQRVPTMNKQQKDILRKMGRPQPAETFEEPKGAKRARHVMQSAARHGSPKSPLEKTAGKFLERGMRKEGGPPISPMETSGQNFLQQMLSRTPEEMLGGEGEERFPQQGNEVEDLRGLSLPDLTRVAQAKRAAIDSGQPLPTTAEILGPQPGQQMPQGTQQGTQAGQGLYGRPLQNQLQSFEAPYMRQFREQTAPEIAERFAMAGGLRGSGFQGAIMNAGGALQENLASLKGNLVNQLREQQLQAANIGLGYAQLPGQRYGQQQQNVNMALPYAQLPAQRWQQQLQAAPAAYQAALYPQQQQQEMNRYAQNVDWQHQQAILNQQPWANMGISPRGHTVSQIPGRIGGAAMGALMGARLGPWSMVAGGLAGALGGGNALPAVNLQMPQPVAASAAPG